MDSYFRLTEINQIDVLNSDWIAKYRQQNPSDSITQRYCEPVKIGQFWYVIKDEITEQYITDYLEIVDYLPSGWHEDLPIRVIIPYPVLTDLIYDKPELIDYMKAPVDAQGNPLPSINYHKEKEGVYIYLSFLHKQHRDIFESEKYKSRIEP